MSFQHRKLMSDSTNQTSYGYICGYCYGSCYSSCYKSCPDLCPPANYPDLYPPPPSPGSESSSPTKPPSTLFMIITFTVLAIAFLLLSSFVYYRRYRRRRRRSDEARRRLSLLPDQTTETIDEFFDEDHGPIIDHPIWYINTVGLQQSTINSIAVCKYKKGQGLVEGTECSVCLNEFREDETLRLLPKCSHAFHLPCIDTWLRSHTNCPLCRAPIVSNAADMNPSSSSVVNTEDTGVLADEETPQSVVMEDGDRESEEQEDELAVENERISRGDQSWGLDEVLIQQPMRRSVSLDTMASSEISHQVIANGNSDNESDKGKESSLRIVSRRRSEGNQRLMRLMPYSSIGKSLQNRPIFMKRSFSCNGKLLSLPMSNDNSRNTKNPPPRSF